MPAQGGVAVSWPDPARRPGPASV